MSAPMRVLSVASEMVPLVKTGGLADVAGALPAALAPLGVNMRTLLPGYPAVLDALRDVAVVHASPSWFGGRARLLAGRHGSLELFVLEAPALFGRPGNPYLDANGRDWPDNAERFAALAATAAAIGRGLVPSFVPDVIHAHDWQTALVPAYLRFRPGGNRPATVLTIHNLAFQGRFGADAMKRINLPPAAFVPEALEYYGDVGFLKAGILIADAITTVSPTYAREIRTPEDGMGLDGLLRHRGDALVGIVNGIDTKLWDPTTDAHLAATYDAHRLEARVANKRAVEERFGLPSSDEPLVCMITRLTTQKGIDLVLDAMDELLATGIRLVVLGTGDRAFEDALRRARERHPDRLGVLIAYDEGLSHLMQGGCDAILIPSRFEPCGLTQLYGLRYGCVPIVARTGGLADTVIDANDAAMRACVGSGFVFSPADGASMRAGIERMRDAYARRETWRAIQRSGMFAAVDWSASAEVFARLYRRVAAVQQARAMHREIDSLKDFYAAINRNDLQAITKAFDAEIVRVEPEGFPTAGTYRGIDAVQAHVAQGRGTWAEGRCEPEGFFVNGDRIVVYLHARVRKHGATEWSGGRFADGFAFRDGKIVEYRSFGERGEALDWAGIERT